MAFLTMYSDHYRAFPIYANPPFLPDEGWCDLKGRWLPEGGLTPEVAWTPEQKADFLRKASRDFFWMSTYMNDYNNNITPENRPWPIRKLKGKKEDPCRPEESKDKKKRAEDPKLESPPQPTVKKSEKESELMRSMREIFERDKNRLVNKPSKTARRILGFGSPYHYQSGVSIYQEDICQPGYIFMRDHLVQRPERADGRLPFSETVFY